jgi:DNA primase
MSDIEHVRDATDLVALISEHVRLEPKGREHVGLCPFHDDSRPSFCVVTHRDTAFYKCFACGESGDCYSFLQKYLNWSFPEALQHLADRAGITLTRKAGNRDEADRQQQRRTWLRKALEQADAWFRKTLDTPDGKAARDCISARGIAPDMVERFSLGAAPDGWQHLHDALACDAMPHKVLESAGLLKCREQENDLRYYDAFRNRLIFPIHDDAGQPVAFGGRDLGEDGPKYLNSKEHDLFQKGRTLYGMHLARTAMREAGRAIVAEGYTDVIACHAAGFTEAVGTLGTAFTDDHARALLRQTAEVVLLFDGDEAGQRAADRAVHVAMRHVLDVRICVLPDAMDPDDLLRQPDGPTRFQAALDQSMDAMSWCLERSGIAETQVGSAARQQRVERLLDALARGGLAKADDMRREMILSRISEKAQVSISTLQRALDARRPRTGATPTAVPEQDEASASPIERELLAVALAALSLNLPAKDVLAVMTTPSLAAVAAAALELLQEGTTVDIPHLHDQLPDEGLRRMATELVEQGHAILQSETDAGEDDAKAVERLTQQLNQRRAQAGMSMKISAWRGDGTSDAAMAARIIEELRATGRRPGAMPRPVGG